jgi:hypothetical protein
LALIRLVFVSSLRIATRILAANFINCSRTPKTEVIDQPDWTGDGFRVTNVENQDPGEPYSAERGLIPSRSALKTAFPFRSVVGRIYEWQLAPQNYNL